MLYPAFPRTSIFLGFLFASFPALLRADAGYQEIPGLVLALSADSIEGEVGQDAGVWPASVEGGIGARAVPELGRPVIAEGGLSGRRVLAFPTGDEGLETGPLGIDGREGLTVFAVIRPEEARLLALNHRRGETGGGSWALRGTQFNVQGGDGPSKMETKAFWSGKFAAQLDGQWLCIAAVVRPLERSAASVNGERVARSPEIVEVVVPNHQPLLIGASLGRAARDGYEFAFRGEMAELLVYDRGLSDEEIRNVESELMQKYALGPLGLNAGQKTRSQNHE